MQKANCTNEHDIKYENIVCNKQSSSVGTRQTTEMLSIINIVHQCTRDRTDHGNVDRKIISQLNMVKLYRIMRHKAIIILILKFTCSVRLFTAFHNIPINSFILSSGLLRPSWMCSMVFTGTDSARDSKCKNSWLLAKHSHCSLTELP